MPITPETLIPVYRDLFENIQRKLPDQISEYLKCRRVVSRHGTCNSVLLWNIWDRRQRQATLPNLYFAYYINYDRDRFETVETDWMLKLHMNTVRIYQSKVDVRKFLIKEIPKVLPKGFRWVEHPRELRVEWPFVISDRLESLSEELLAPAVELINSTHPVINRLINMLEPVEQAVRQEIIWGRNRIHAPATKGANVQNKAAYRHGIPPKLRIAVLNLYGHKCAICKTKLASTDEVHIDHIIPFSEGGLTQLGNLQPSHAKCNLKKGSGRKIPSEWRKPAKIRVGWQKKKNA
jgi:5-methylcytosine-specific restriction endonuclease McrA